MAGVETNITISLPDGADAEQYIAAIRQILGNLNGLETRVNVHEVDDLVSASPIFRIKELEV